MDVARSQRSSGVRSQHQPAISSGENEVDNVLSESLLTPLAGEFGTHIDRIPPKRSTVLGMAIVPMTSGEEERTIADVYGRNPPEAALVDERLNALEREVGRLKREERSSLENALRHHPLLTVASPHVRAMIREEDYDAPSAARRLARYWRQRESLFGSRAFSTDIFTQPDFDDYMCHYNRCLRSMHDLELDGEMRYMAREYVSIVNRVKIEAMDKLIDEAPEKDREALMEARRVNPEVAQSDEHKILFLKCEDLVEASAAVRMMKYWEMKKLLFGPDKLGKEITLADVETSVFESDVIVHSLLVPDTDEAGRCVFWVNGKELAREGWTADGVAQYMWCILHIALARPSCRDNGIVLMIDKRYLATAAKDYNFAGRRLMVKLTTRCLPLRVCAIHIFFAPSSWWQRYMIPVFSMVGVFGKKRTVVHIETSEENRRVLKEQFGIGPNLVLKDLGGNVDTDWWKGWIRERREEECS